MNRKLVSFDWAIKKLLRSKVNFGILEGFLSELLYEDVKIIEVIESESNKESQKDKSNRVDLKVLDSENKILIVEIQYDSQLDFLQRILYGASKTIAEHMNEGDAYKEVTRIISVNILYFKLGDGEDYIYCGKTEFYGLHNKSELKLSSKQKKVFKVDNVSDIYPKYYLIEIVNFNDIAKNTLDEWIYFLKNEEIKENFSAKGIKEAKQKLDILKMSDSEFYEYKRFQESLHQDASMYESHYVDGKRDGGKEKSKEIAQKMISRGMSDNEITELTGLTDEEIKNLK